MKVGSISLRGWSTSKSLVDMENYVLLAIDLRIICNWINYYVTGLLPM